jgi:hydrogenase maturation protease
VVGIGNPDCGDDGVGPEVARRLCECALPEAVIMERSGDALALIEDWAGHDAVVLVDAAAAPDGVPGRLHRIDFLKDALPSGLALSSTHALGVAEAVGLARALGRLPERLVAYAVEGENFAPGAGLSPVVAAAVEGVVARVEAEIARLAKEKAHA